MLYKRPKENSCTAFKEYLGSVYFRHCQNKGSMKISKTYPYLFFLCLLTSVSCSTGTRSDEAFEVLHQEFAHINSNSQTQNEELMVLLKRRVAGSGDDENAKTVFEHATMTVAIVSDLQQFLNHLKKELVEYEGVQSFEDYSKGEKLKDAGNKEAVQDVLLNGDFKGKRLKNTMNDARTALIGFAEKFEGADVRELDRLDSLLHLRAEDQAEPSPQYWEFKMFDGLSKSAALALLGMIENQAIQAEHVFLETCLNQTRAAGLNISDFDVVSVPNDYTISLGDTFESRVFLTAVAPIRGSKVLVDGKDVTQEDFVGKFTTVPDKTGMHSHKAKLQYRNEKTGKQETYEGEIRYYVY